MELTNSKRMIIPAAKVVGLYLIWWVFFEYRYFDTYWIDQRLINLLVALSFKVGEFFNRNMFGQGDYVGILGQGYVHIGPPCNGLSLVYLYVSFFLIVPGAALKKLLYVISGTLGIQILNVLRIFLLAVISVSHPDWLQFNHKYTFTAFIYIITFLIWLHFLNRVKSEAVTSEE